MNVKKRNKDFSVNYVFASIICLEIYLLLPLSPQYSMGFIASLSLGSVLAFLAIQSILKSNKDSRSITHSNIKYISALTIIAYIMLLVSLLNMLFNIGQYTVFTMINDIFSLLIYMSGIGFLTKDYKVNFKKLLFLIGFIGLILGLIAIFQSNFQIESINDRRENTWKSQYILWFTLYPWAYLVLYKVIMKEKLNLLQNIIVVGCSTEYVILAFLFLKRIVLLEIAIIIILIIFSITNKPKRAIKIIFSTVFIAAIAYVLLFKFTDFHKIIEITLNRVEDESIGKFDRITEFKELFETYPMNTILHGAGLGAFQNGPGGINLHIGWLNYIFKGGLLLLGLHAWVLSKAIKLFFISNDDWGKFISAACLFYFFSILISSAWVASPSLMLSSIIINLMLNYNAE